MPKKILINSSDDSLITILQKVLVEKGHEVIIDRTGSFAAKPDLCLIDIGYPEDKGFDLMEKAKKEGLPFIAISNSGQLIETDQSKMLGAKDIIIKKEFDIDTVINKIEEAIK